jgi:ketopantoate reductase
MHKPVVIIGMGEMGGVFARGLLRCGHPVYPITRGMKMATESQSLPTPELVLVAVAEGDLDQTLAQIPAAWRDRLALLQNELLPQTWQIHGLEKPTVISVWFEKKRGQDVKVLIPSPIHGPHARLLADALDSIAIPNRIVATAQEMLQELVRKNLYIVTTNVAGLEVGGTVSELWRQHETLTRAVANDVLDIQQQLVGEALPRARLIEGMLEAFAGDPDHKCLGRTAPARLARALQQAAAAGLNVPALKRIAAKPR